MADQTVYVKIVRAVAVRKKRQWEAENHGNAFNKDWEINQQTAEEVATAEYKRASHPNEVPALVRNYFHTLAVTVRKDMTARGVDCKSAREKLAHRLIRRGTGVQDAVKMRAYRAVGYLMLDAGDEWVLTGSSVMGPDVCIGGQVLWDKIVPPAQEAATTAFATRAQPHETPALFGSFFATFMAQACTLRKGSKLPWGAVKTRLAAHLIRPHAIFPADPVKAAAYTTAAMQLAAIPDGASAPPSTPPSTSSTAVRSEPRRATPSIAAAAAAPAAAATAAVASMLAQDAHTLTAACANTPEPATMAPGLDHTEVREVQPHVSIGSEASASASAAAAAVAAVTSIPVGAGAAVTGTGAGATDAAGGDSLSSLMLEGYALGPDDAEVAGVEPHVPIALEASAAAVMAAAVAAVTPSPVAAGVGVEGAATALVASAPPAATLNNSELSDAWMPPISPGREAMGSTSGPDVDMGSGASGPTDGGGGDGGSSHGMKRKADNGGGDGDTENHPCDGGPRKKARSGG